MKVTALNQIHKDLGAKMVPFAGFEMPVQYSGVNNEHMVVRDGVGVFDVSHMGQIFVSGADAKKLLQHIGTNDVEKVEVGQAQYTCMPNEKGGIVDDLIIYKFADDKWLLVVNASNIDKDFNWIKQNNSWDVKVENKSDDYSLLAIQGPKAVESMQALTDENLSEIPFYHFKTGKFAGIEDVIISATGYTGSGGFEIYFKNEDAVHIWNKVMEAGKDFGIEPCGLGARDTLRLEKGYCLYGNDINDETTPLEAGLGWITKLNTDFIAKDILAAQKEAGIDKKLVGFKLTERGIPRHGYEIVNADDEIIGTVTSGTMLPDSRKGIGMGYVKTEYIKPDSTIFIKIRTKNLEAKIIK